MRYYHGRRLYRSRDGIIWGVCQGLADWMDVQAGIIRAIALVIFVLSGFFPIAGIYAVAALVMPLEPADTAYRHDHREYDWERRFYH